MRIICGIYADSMRIMCGFYTEMKVQLGCVCMSALHTFLLSQSNNYEYFNGCRIYVDILTVENLSSI